MVDFGIARLLDDAESGTVGIGTPRFMAPEVLAGGSISPRTDVFGVAATLWTLIAGRTPVYADPTKLSSLAPDVTPELERTIAAGLEMIPERRVASMAAFAKALGAPLRTETGISLAVSIDTPDASRSLMEAVVHTAAGVFGAAAASIALVDETTGELVYQSAWGAGAREIVGVRLPARHRHRRSAWSKPASPRRCPTAAPIRASRLGIAAGTGYVPVHHARRPAAPSRAADRRAGDPRPPRRSRLRQEDLEPAVAVRRPGGQGARRDTGFVHEPGHDLSSG